MNNWKSLSNNRKKKLRKYIFDYLIQERNFFESIEDYSEVENLSIDRIIFDLKNEINLTMAKRKLLISIQKIFPGAKNPDFEFDAFGKDTTRIKLWIGRKIYRFD